MLDRRSKNSSGDTFTFSDMSESEFEFGCVTPVSPRSPADHLFSNGKLLPHSFPLQPRNSTSYSRSMSRTSSISSKDSSFLSSRSNSTNSSSSCSSARTSISTETCSSFEKKISSQGKVACKIQVTKERKKHGEKPVLTSQLYGSSQRWLFISPMPALNHQTSRRKRSSGETAVKKELKKGRKKKVVEGNKSEKQSKGYLRNFFMYFVLTCGACHAMNPIERERAEREF